MTTRAIATRDSLSTASPTSPMRSGSTSMATLACDCQPPHLVGDAAGRRTRGGWQTLTRPWDRHPVTQRSAFRSAPTQPTPPTSAPSKQARRCAPAPMTAASRPHTRTNLRSRGPAQPPTARPTPTPIRAWVRRQHRRRRPMPLKGWRTRHRHRHRRHRPMLPHRRLRRRLHHSRRTVGVTRAALRPLRRQVSLTNTGVRPRTSSHSPTPTSRHLNRPSTTTSSLIVVTAT